MIRNLKVLGLALVAVLATSAMVSSAASAHVFKSEKTPVVLTTTASHTEEHVFTYGGNPVKCKKIEFKTTTTDSPSANITIHPNYTECTFAGIPAEVRVTHCDYLFTGATTVEGGEEHAKVKIECANAGETIDIIIPSFNNCTMTIAPGQETTKGVRYTNTGAGATRDVTVKVTAEIPVTRVANVNAFCSALPLAGVGKYTGNSVLQGFEDKGGPTLVTDANTYTTRTYTEGAQVGVFFE